MNSKNITATNDEGAHLSSENGYNYGVFNFGFQKSSVKESS